MLRFRTKPLPGPAERFLKEYSVGRSKNTINLYRGGLHHFHRFLNQSKIDFTRLELFHIKQFDEDLEQHNLKFVTRREHIHHIHYYYRWLEHEKFVQQGLCAKLFPNYKPEHVVGQQAHLPELALRFLEVLQATNKPDTVKGYQSALRAFYKLYWKTGKRPYTIERTDVETFMISQKARGLGANQRFARLLQLRRYLDWLYEHNKLRREPGDLLTSKDFPKKEEKLPRPFPVDVDLEVQKRLWESSEIDYQGLLLMRRCGLRVGELRNLTIDCVGEDLNGHWFLKVPLGKLNNERIFPLDLKTVELVERIKRHHCLRPEPGTNNKYLISNPYGRRRSRAHFAAILHEVTKDLAIPGKVTLHRLRHSFATSLLSAGMSITTLKTLMGHRDIRMTLNYAAITQETIRNEYFTALTKVQSRYEVASYPLKTPDLRDGVSRAFYDAQKYIKKCSQEFGNPHPQKLKLLLYRLNSLRHEFSVLLKSDPD
jgi:site-specific recombinase XerD